MAALLPAAATARALTLEEALNATNLTWMTTGWTPQTHTTHDGVAAAQSGSTFASTSTLQTAVTGPGTLTFWWRNPSYNNNAQRFYRVRRW